MPPTDTLIREKHSSSRKFSSILWLQKSNKNFKNITLLLHHLHYIFYSFCQKIYLKYWKLKRRAFNYIFLRLTLSIYSFLLYLLIFESSNHIYLTIWKYFVRNLIKINKLIIKIWKYLNWYRKHPIVKKYQNSSTSGNDSKIDYKISFSQTLVK